MTGKLPSNQFSDEQKNKKSKKNKKRRLYFAQEREWKYMYEIYNETQQVGYSEYSISSLAFKIRSSPKFNAHLCLNFFLSKLHVKG